MDKEQTESIPSELLRYAKQIRFNAIGLTGQRALSAARVVIIGCGALGSVSANLLARAGVGRMLVIDRDFVELDNLQRQVLYDEADVGMPKAIVAAGRLQAVNSEIEIEGRIADVDFRNIEEFLLQPDPAVVVVDGTDNFEIRFLINDACVKHSIPWVYAGCLGAEGQVMTILPGDTACLNCLMSAGPPPPGTSGTCDTGGILSMIVNVVAAMQATEALKILAGRTESVNRRLAVFDLWGNRNHSMDISKLRDDSDCVVCQHRQFDWISGQRGSQSVSLCGRNAVQVSFPERNELPLEQLAQRLGSVGTVELNRYLVRLRVNGYVITAFRDGRAIINGTDDIAIARKLYAQYIGT